MSRKKTGHGVLRSPLITQYSSLVFNGHAESSGLRPQVSRPLVRQVLRIQTIVVPALALETFETTVLNCFLFRQTNLILRATVCESATPLNLDQQRCVGKMKIDFAFCSRHESLIGTTLGRSLDSLTKATRRPQIPDANAECRRPPGVGPAQRPAGKLDTARC